MFSFTQETGDALALPSKIFHGRKTPILELFCTTYVIIIQCNFMNAHKDWISENPCLGNILMTNNTLYDKDS